MCRKLICLHNQTTPLGLFQSAMSSNTPGSMTRGGSFVVTLEGYKTYCAHTRRTNAALIHHYISYVNRPKYVPNIINNLYSINIPEVSLLLKL